MRLSKYGLCMFTGLYESLAGIPAGDPEALGQAVAGVWASLYTRRAVLSRRAAGAAQLPALNILRASVFALILLQHIRQMHCV